MTTIRIINMNPEAMLSANGTRTLARFDADIGELRMCGCALLEKNGFQYAALPTARSSRGARRAITWRGDEARQRFNAAAVDRYQAMLAGEPEEPVALAGVRRMLRIDQAESETLDAAGF